MATGIAHIDFFWGKAAGASDDEPGWHPLAYHCLDVGAAADALLSAKPNRLAALAGLLGTSGDCARRFLTAIIALHDVGKFSPSFQAKSEDAWRDAARPLLGEWRAPPPGVRHDVDGFVLRDEVPLKGLLSPACDDWCNSDIARLWQAICGHHGQPVGGWSNHVLDWLDDEPVCLDAAKAFCQDACRLLGAFQPMPQPSEAALAAVSWHVSGLTMIADWIGSNRNWFPYHRPDLPLVDYWKKSRGNAVDAVVAAGLLAPPKSATLGPGDLLPEIAANLSPLQQQVSETALPEGPLLAIIEDVTGAGKTEAALLLAARLLKADRAEGLYFALPTMATANAMYDRLGAIYRRFFDNELDRLPSLILSHGKRHLNPGFTESILPLQSKAEDYPDEGAAACAAWIADDRRKAFLAQIGVGTIDQAILAVLPSRHQAMRLWGLADKVLIIDEAHAYDAFMSREIETLLGFHAALGGSAIVLSATLPEAQRQRMATAFRLGLGGKPSVRADVGTTASYPLLTLVSRGEENRVEVATRKDRRRTLPVRRMPIFAQAVDEIAAMAAEGAAVAWIRNGVDDTIEAAWALEAKGLSPTLLHARFAMGDRLDIEEQVRNRLGRSGSESDRRGYVVVGSQILEQSLDYDVDGMIVDLAPIDLMIQRAGRLWRHMDRKERPRAAPELLVVAPDPADVKAADWYGQMSQRAAAVYRHHGIVWRSAKALFDTRMISTPAGVRPLVEAVYGRDDLSDVPEPLQRASREAFGAERAAVSYANACLLDVEAGYGGDMHLWESDQIVATRLGEPVTVFRLARLDGNAVVPWYPDEQPMRAWALSEVSLARRKADGVPQLDRATAKAIAAVKQTWPKWEREMPVLILELVGDEVWRGEVTVASKAAGVLYDRKWGLRFASP